MIIELFATDQPDAAAHTAEPAPTGLYKSLHSQRIDWQEIQSK